MCKKRRIIIESTCKEKISNFTMCENYFFPQSKLLAMILVNVIQKK